MFFLLLLCAFAVRLTKRFVNEQKQAVNMLVHSIEELEEKIYQNERPDNVDFKEIIRLTSNGLSDGLTGVVTRSVFFKQAEAQLDKVPEERLVALCFVDLDNLKKLNDTTWPCGGRYGAQKASVIFSGNMRRSMTALWDGTEEMSLYCRY